jgi:subtilisin
VTGTSFACPHISGHVARVLSANPGLTPFQVKTLLFAMGARNRERACRAEGA